MQNKNIKTLKELAKNRAKSARDALMAAGVDEARIELRKPQSVDGGASRHRQTGKAEAEQDQPDRHPGVADVEDEDQRVGGGAASTLRIACQPEFLEPADVAQFPQRRVQAGSLRHHQPGQGGAQDVNAVQGRMIATRNALGDMAAREEKKYPIGLMDMVALSGHNPILAPQPFGAGRVFSSYQMLKIPLTAAFQVAPNFSLGFSPIPPIAAWFVRAK